MRTPDARTIVIAAATLKPATTPNEAISRPPSGAPITRGTRTRIDCTLKAIAHHFSEFNWVFSGSDLVVCEGTSHGEHRDGPWRAGVPEWAAGRWCDVFEIRDWQIQRCFIYLDPDYAGKDTARYPWLNAK